MDALLDTELGHQHIEGSIQDTNDSSSPHDRTVFLGQIRNEHTQVQVGRLLLCESSTLLLAVRVRISVSVQNLGKDSSYMLHC
jgi:hypothetical protein